MRSPAKSGTARQKALALLLGSVVAVVLGESVCEVLFSCHPSWGRHREVLRSGEASTFQSCTPHPYLLYAPAPNFSWGGNWHNSQGYRGKAVSMLKPHGVARVLCLGGSTTYGTGVDRPETAYPAVMEELLNEELPPGYESVEVINGGLPYATTAEIVAQYHFKFQYFSPDVVVINTGGNDAHYQRRDRRWYQPDYTHVRQSFAAAAPLSPLGRTMLSSNMGALFLTRLYGDASLNLTIERPDMQQPPSARWHPAAITPNLMPHLPDEELGFTRNLRRVVEMVLADGGDLVLVPFRIAPGAEDEEAADQCARNERILYAVAQEYEIPVAPFTHDCISPDQWVDSCHLASGGQRQKAEHIARYVREVLRRRAADDDDDLAGMSEQTAEPLSEL